MTAAPRLAHYEDLFDLPENMVGEIIDGQMHTQPRPAPAHALATSNLGVELGQPFGRGRGGPGGWWILDEPELHLNADIFVPDLAGWRRERMPNLPKTAWFEMAPDWVCEVLSPATARTDRILKLPRYAAAGIAHCWLIDPEVRKSVPWKLSPIRTVIGCCSAPGAAMMKPALILLRRFLCRWPGFGWIEEYAPAS